MVGMRRGNEGEGLVVFKACVKPVMGLGQSSVSEVVPQLETTTPILSPSSYRRVVLFTYICTYITFYFYTLLYVHGVPREVVELPPFTI